MPTKQYIELFNCDSVDEYEYSKDYADVILITNTTNEKATVPFKKTSLSITFKEFERIYNEFKKLTNENR